MLLQAKICYAADLNKAIFVLPEARHHEESEPRENLFKIDDKRSRPLNESDFNGFDSPDIAGSRDLDGGIMLTPERIAMDINRQAQAAHPGYRVPYLVAK